MIEAIITYSNLSEVEGRFYSRQAKEFVERTEQIKQRNQAILGNARSIRLPEASDRDTTRYPACSCATCSKASSNPTGRNPAAA